MKIGTKSVIFGVHQFILHPLLVWISWLLVYGRPPSAGITFCIIFHDIGYIGKESMDGEDGKKHPEIGAKIVLYLLGKNYADITLYHSRSYADAHKKNTSVICLPDKLSILLYPSWLYLLLGKLSGEIYEYKYRMGLLHLTDQDWLIYTKRLAFRWAINSAPENLTPRIIKLFHRHQKSQEEINADISLMSH